MNTFTIIDDDGAIYDLDTFLIDFDRVLAGETNKLKVILSNNGPLVNEVEIECVAHPTDQEGLPANTYEAAELSLSESGTYYPILPIASIATGIQTDIWIRWIIPTTILPGPLKFAIQVRGKVVWT